MRMKLNWNPIYIRRYSGVTLWYEVNQARIQGYRNSIENRAKTKSFSRKIRDSLGQALRKEFRNGSRDSEWFNRLDARLRIIGGHEDKKRGRFDWKQSTRSRAANSNGESSLSRSFPGWNVTTCWLCELYATFQSVIHQRFYTRHSLIIQRSRVAKTFLWFTLTYISCQEIYIIFLLLSQSSVTTINDFYLFSYLAKSANYSKQYEK